MFDKNRYKEVSSEEDLEELLEEATKHGAILSYLYFDAHGPSKDGVENSLVDFVGKLSKERGVLYCKGEVFQALEVPDEGLSPQLRFSCSTQVKILARDFSTLLGLCLKYGPIGVEILQPYEIHLTVEEAQALLLDSSQSTQDYVKYILEKTMTPDEKLRLNEHLRRRQELAEKLRSQKKA